MNLLGCVLGLVSTCGPGGITGALQLFACQLQSESGEGERGKSQTAVLSFELISSRTVKLSWSLSWPLWTSNLWESRWGLPGALVWI
ncbi:unnamed protein product [Boreogadus saida]